MLDAIFERFAKKSPVSVIARGLMERVLNPEQIDKWFDQSAEQQYTRNLLFSTVFDMMSDVVCGPCKSIHSSYQATKEEINVAIKSVYNKLNGIEVKTSESLVRYAAGEIKEIIENLGGARPPLLPGFKVKILDGNCLEATEHRIGKLRPLAAGPLPGKSLVVLDPSLRMPVDVFLSEDGHAQERSMLPAVLTTVEPADVWVADRNFCTRSFLVGIKDRDAFFVIREHKSIPSEPLTEEQCAGNIETGKVFEQYIQITDESGNKHKFRRIRIRLNKPTRDQDTDICILSNLSKRSTHAQTIALLYRDRWKIEKVFQELEAHLHSEINTLGYPPAALFAFCIALIAYIILAGLKGAMSSVHGEDTVENKISGYYLSDELSATYRGMMIAIADEEWIVFRHYPMTELIKILKQLAANIRLSAFQKHPRGPKRKQPKRISDPSTPHVSTAKILANGK
jgi:hypothetical protein